MARCRSMRRHPPDLDPPDRAMNNVPVVDISDPTATARHALDAACRDHGFFLLVGHGLDELLAETWAETERFFDAPGTSAPPSVAPNRTRSGGSTGN